MCQRGFTVIELTVVLALVAVASTLVIVRLDFGSSRQKLINDARKLGNLICTIRARAVADDCLYRIILRSDNANYLVEKQDVTSTARFRTLEVRALSAGVVFDRVIQQNQEARFPVTLYFDGRGVLLPTTITLTEPTNGLRIAVSPLPIANEVDYDER